MKTKKCSACGRYKLITSFGRKKLTSLTGTRWTLRSNCKRCANKKTLAYLGRIRGALSQNDQMMFDNLAAKKRLWKDKMLEKIGGKKKPPKKIMTKEEEILAKKMVEAIRGKIAPDWLMKVPQKY